MYKPLNHMYESEVLLCCCAYESGAEFTQSPCAPHGLSISNCPMHACERPCTWQAPSNALSQFPRAGFNIQNTVQKLPGGRPVKRPRSGTHSSIGYKAGRAGLSGQIESRQLYCGERPLVAGLLEQKRRRKNDGETNCQF